MQDVADDEADVDRGSESAAGAQSPSNAAGGSKVESDEAGAKSPSNAAGGSEVEGDKAGAQSGEAGAPRYKDGQLLNVDEGKVVGVCAPRLLGLRFCSVEKQGDVFVTSRDMAFGEFRVLYDIRFREQTEYALEWDAFWHMPAQKACPQFLQEVRQRELGPQRLGTVNRQRKSQFNTFCWQRFGGHQWVTLFFAFRRLMLPVCST